MRSILVVGATGLLGVPLCNLLESHDYRVIRVAKSLGFDFTDYENTIDLLNKVRPRFIVNLAAMTNVDNCEYDKAAAERLNVHIVENIVRWAEQNDCFFIQLSTDMVYQGLGLHQEDGVNPMNHYATTKLAGEQIARQMQRSAVLRTNFFGYSEVKHRKSFSDWLLESFYSHSDIKLFNDVYFSPLEISTLCNLIMQVISVEKEGVYNLGSHEGMNKYEFSLELAYFFGFNADCISEISIDKVNLAALRPKDMRMDVRLFEKTFGIKLPTLRQEIKKLIRNKNGKTIQ